ncbi:hypothetical protein BDV96DRAFT_562919 [Lophiotrema nucula]|uniref:Uncharacterized protein n=1 Tax=Lophiotrema nucula TaxID=690887 RepID=A0A6A5ZQY7_9PLEO|nr:hypothetical protein BDV96DRAFT_562919 [Lophiotrema nucula]
MQLQPRQRLDLPMAPKRKDKGELDVNAMKTYNEVLVSVKVSITSENVVYHNGVVHLLKLAADLCNFINGPPYIIENSLLHLDEKGPPYLQTLPSEIRNLIYEFALTYKETLVCRDKQTSARQAQLRQATGERGRVQRNNFPVSAKAHKEGQDSLRLYLSATDDIEANQIQYICRQLRGETKGLKLKYNVTAFLHTHVRDGSAFHPLRQFRLFSTICSTQWFCCISKIVLLHTDLPKLIQYAEDTDDELLNEQ